MKTAALATLQPAPLAISPELAEGTRAFLEASKAKETRRAYSRQWKRFVGWCGEHGFPSLPTTPEVLALYVSARAQGGWKPAGLDQALAAVALAHTTAGHLSPRGAAPVKEVMAGIRRTLGSAQRRAAPLLAGHLRTILEVPPSSLRGLRDRALLLVGFSGAFRRSELVSLTVEDVAFVTEGLEVTLRRSKTDQEGKGTLKAIAYAGSPAVCPVRALRTWLDAAGIQGGPLFREVTRHEAISAKALSGRSVARIVKGCARAAGLESERMSGHSLRAGFATQAALAHKPEQSIQRQTGHKSVDMLRRYIRVAEVWTDNASVGIMDG